MPTQYINEDYATVGDDLIFPNVQTCAAVIVTDAAGHYGGYHITIASTLAEVTGACRYITGALPPGAPAAVYVAGNYQRTGATGAGANGGLATVLRTALAYAGRVRYFQSSPAQMLGLAVRFHTSGGMPRLLIADPRQWQMAPNVAVDPAMRKVGRDGAVAAPRFPTLPSATMQGGLRPWLLGGLEQA